MAKAIKIPNFEVDHHWRDRFSVEWKDGETRYHYWIDRGRMDGDTLHRNSDGKHTALSLSAKKWAPLILAINTKIDAEDLLTKAREAKVAKEMQEAEDREAARNVVLRNKLAAALVELPTDLAVQLAALPVDTRTAFAKAFEAHP